MINKCCARTFRQCAIGAAIIVGTLGGPGSSAAQDATSEEVAQDALSEAVEQKPAATDLDPKEKPVLSDPQLQQKYVWSTIGLDGAIGATISSGLSQLQHSPPEWTGKRGYGQRWASAYAEAAISDTTKYAVSRLLHHDPSFTPCRCTGLGPRIRYALVAPFTARNRDGKRVLSPAIFAGIVAGDVVSRSTWYPTGYGAGDGLRKAATGLLSKMGVSIWKEFRPRGKNMFKLQLPKP